MVRVEPNDERFFRSTGLSVAEDVAEEWKSIFPDWMRDAACSGESSEIFFGASDPTVRPQHTPTQIKKARQMCAGCPIARKCLTTSLSNNDEYGVFGGSNRTNRAKMLKRIKSGITTLEDEVNQFLVWLKEAYSV